MEINHQKIETIVPKWFHQWLKVFGKVESERMLVKKVWDYAVTLELKNSFKRQYKRIYSAILSWWGALQSSPMGPKRDLEARMDGHT